MGKGSCVQRAALAVDRQAGLSNPNQDSFLPLGDTGFLQREERAGLSGSRHWVKEVSKAMHTMASVTAHLHFVGGAHGVGHLEKHPGPQSTERW